MPRERIYKTDADRQAAYRRRKHNQEKALDKLREAVNTAASIGDPEAVGLHVYKWDDNERLLEKVTQWFEKRTQDFLNRVKDIS